MFVCGNVKIDIRQIPKGYEWIAQDRNGQVWVFIERPVEREEYKWDFDLTTSGENRHAIRIECDSEFNFGWKESLVEIPSLKRNLERILNEDEN